ncbi:MAG: FAD-dependent oxidoreductase [Fuerstiella sp.]|nr:FAD-dependent oxidoreductase [Fuerstiella sp.]MCP4859201.1 FAD-dependent oxidoreductase [Fuerstiella sp.]
MLRRTPKSEQRQPQRNKSLGVLLVFLTCSAGSAPAVEELSTELLVVGGTESGWAAAIQAARLGVRSVTIVHDGDWLGGQFTEQALACVDENKGVGRVGWGVDWHPMKRSFHRSGLFKELMDHIEAFNTRKYGASMPGRPYHGPSTFRPAEAEAIFRQMLQPLVDSGQVRLITNRYPVAADVDYASPHPRLTGVHFATLGSRNEDLHIRAKMTIDASDWGEAIQVAGAAYECGPDAQSRYHEPSAPIDLSNNPHNEMNPITWAMIVEEAEHDSPIERPQRYDDRNFVRTSKLSLAAMTGLPWDRPVKLGSIPHWPDSGKQSPRQLSIYTVRRIVDGTTSKDHRTSILLNYMLGQDYPLERLPQDVIAKLESDERGASGKNIVQMSRTQRSMIFDDAKRHSLCLLHHLQNFVHDAARDRGNSFLHFRLSDEFGTADRLPPKPYIRESLRLKAMYMMREQDGRNADDFTKDLARERFARVLYPDGIFCWQFHYDFHRTGRAYLKQSDDKLSWGNAGPWIDFEKPGRNTRYVSDRCVFPLRSLIPEAMDGLLGAQKNLGYSSIVCAAIRLHDQCVAAGQAAGAAAAVAMRHGISARSIPYDRGLIEEVRHAVCGEVLNAEPLLIWPYRDLPTSHAAFVAINRLAALRIIPLEIRNVDFRPDERASNEWQHNLLENTTRRFHAPDLPTSSPEEISRADFCRSLWDVVHELRPQPWTRLSDRDADNDGIVDADDPLPFSAGKAVEWKIEAPTPDRDGLPDSGVATAAASLRINFTTPDSPTTDGFVNDTGLLYRNDRRFGWRRDLRTNNRRRKVLAENIRDTFVFTRDEDVWEYLIENGTWEVTACLGDAAHDQRGQRFNVEGRQLVDEESSAAGQFIEVSSTVDVNDGRLTITLGPQQPNCNTCLNWVIITKTQ